MGGALQAQKGHFYTLEAALVAPEKVITLNLSSKGLRVLPEALAACKNLKVLNLNNNQFKTLPAFVANFQQLETLLLNNNPIKRFPRVILALTQLHNLSLSDCPLQCYPRALTALGMDQSMENTHSSVATSIIPVAQFEDHHSRRGTVAAYIPQNTTTKTIASFRTQSKPIACIAQRIGKLVGVRAIVFSQ